MAIVQGLHRHNCVCQWRTGKIESTIRFIKGNFWPGIEFDSLSELNRHALVWCGEVNRRVHSTTREIPQLRFPHEGLVALNGQPA